MALTFPSDRILHPGEIEAVDDDGATTHEGRLLAHDLTDCARALESRFGTLRAQMRDYESWWRQEPVRWTSGQDRELADTLPAMPNAKGRILAARVVRANVKERVEFKISINADWTQDERAATQALERYCYGSLWMADIERRRRKLGHIQPTLAWYGAVRGAAIAIPFVRKSPRQADGDQYGSVEPYVVRTPDPITCVWDEGSYGLTFFATIDWRPASDFYASPHLKEIAPSGEGRYRGYCEHVNVWWCDGDRNVWNATIVEGCFDIPPTNHTKARGLTRLPVFLDTPGYGSPPDALIADSDETSIADHYQGVMENNINAYAVESYIDSINMRLMKDAAQWILATASETPLNAEQLKEAMKGNGLIQLGKDGRIYTVAPPQLSDSLVRWKAELDARQQLGGMPNTAVAGVEVGMTGVAIQEALLQGDFVAGPVSHMLKRMYEDIAHCLISQHRALGRKIKVKGIDKGRGLFTVGVDAAHLPPPDDYIIEAVHKPALVRDGYRDAQEAATWKAAGRSWISIADEFFADPAREQSLTDQEQLNAIPEIKLSIFLTEAIKLYGPQSQPAKLAATMLNARLQQMAAESAPPPGPTNAPAPGAAMDAAPMPQLPGGPARPTPAGVDPTEPIAQEMLGQIGAEQGGSYGY